MKVRGTTINTPIARHAVTDDTCVSKKAWSSKNTVDMLCPAFEEIGDVVVCEPVEGYPLEVTTFIPETAEGITSLTLNHTGRNLYKPTYKGGTIKGITCVSNGDGTYTFNGTATGDANFDISLGSGFVPMFKEGMCLSGCPEGGSSSTYYLVLPFVGYYEHGKGLPINYNAGHASSWTSAVRIVIKAGQTVENLVFKPQITVGKKLYPFEPYTGESFTVKFDEPAYDGTYNWTAEREIKARSGVNYFFSNVGETEVKGRADVKAVIEKLTSAVISLGGNV